MPVVPVVELINADANVDLPKSLNKKTDSDFTIAIYPGYRIVYVVCEHLIWFYCYCLAQIMNKRVIGGQEKLLNWFHFYEWDTIHLSIFYRLRFTSSLYASSCWIHFKVMLLLLLFCFFCRKIYKWNGKMKNKKRTLSFVSYYYKFRCT